MSNVKEFPEFDDAELQELNKSVLLEKYKDAMEQNIALHQENRNLQKTLQERNREIKQLTYNFDRIRLDLEDEMEKAKRIQEGLLPRELPRMINVKSASVYIPAGKVGGDLYDIIITPRQKIAVLIFDVSGQGIPAALIGAMAKMLFAHYIEKLLSPAEIFTEVNKHLCRFIKTEQYLTAFLGIIDPIKNTMEYSRAGHVPPLVYKSKTGDLSRLDAKGFFIGHTALQDIAEYSNQTVSLDAGDKILFYTDGLTEGCSSEGKLYGLERLKTVFKKCGSLELEPLLDCIVKDQEEFRDNTPLRDDFTLLGIEIGDSDFLLADSGFQRSDEPNILVINTLSEIEDSCAVILKEMDRCGYNDKSIRQFKICIFEMLTNAILHGNRGDPNKKVIIFYQINTFAAAISVIDEGEGYDPSSLPDPLLPENRMKDHGRGVFLIKHYLDQVEFNARGNRILGRKFHTGR